MKIIDSNNITKIHLSKCQVQEIFPESTMYKWEEVDPINIYYLSQPNHINFKTIEELEACFSALRKEFRELNSNEQKLVLKGEFR
ncbi:hypothetical protein LCGC14_1325360 [marine sediment metagenome]|uniref:Uncharacterized protein n=1 Tax=marine sediment metagenome TaxID=412755 RepID=A0A0F9NKP7_9ZZZZ